MFTLEECEAKSGAKESPPSVQTKLMAAKRPFPAPFPAAADTINIDSHPPGVSRFPCPLRSFECSLPVAS
jgi:hypothetical protein